MDIVDAATRSRMMSKIRAKDTQPEFLVRRFLHSHGFRYKLHDPALPGKPDIVLPKYRTVIFVNGCFWHQHSGCAYASVPASNRERWTSKFAETALRDERNVEALKGHHWRVITVWECALNKKMLKTTLMKLIEEIENPE